MRGKLLVIEGTEGSGKETQADLLVKRLNEMGEKAVKMRFPMYDTPTGKIIYEHILIRMGIVILMKRLILRHYLYIMLLIELII